MVASVGSTRHYAHRDEVRAISDIITGSYFLKRMVSLAAASLP